MTDEEGYWKRNLGRHLIEFLIGGLAATLFEFFFDFYFASLWPKLKGLLHLWWLTPDGTVVIFLVGLGLFFFKKYRQKMYGLGEIGFALAVGWSSMMQAQSTNDMTSWITLLASAYLVVRGLSNYDEGRERENIAATI